MLWFFSILVTITIFTFWIPLVLYGIPSIKECTRIIVVTDLALYNAKGLFNTTNCNSPFLHPLESQWYNESKDVTSMYTIISVNQYDYDYNLRLNTSDLDTICSCPVFFDPDTKQFFLYSENVGNGDCNGIEGINDHINCLTINFMIFGIGGGIASVFVALAYYGIKCCIAEHKKKSEQHEQHKLPVNKQ
jgi:hypothetical protein